MERLSNRLAIVAGAVFVTVAVFATVGYLGSAAIPYAADREDKRPDPMPSIGPRPDEEDPNEEDADTTVAEAPGQMGPGTVAGEDPNEEDADTAEAEDPNEDGNGKPVEDLEPDGLPTFPAGGSSALERCRETASKLLDAQLVFDPKIEMEIDRPQVVQAALTRDLEIPPDDLLPDAKGAIAELVAVPCRVEARLGYSTQDFEVNPSTYSEQFVVDDSDARWSWLVTPLKQGTLPLVLNVRGVLEDANGDLTTSPVTKRVEIAAHVSGAALALDEWLDSVNENVVFGISSEELRVDRSEQTTFVVEIPQLELPPEIKPVPGDRIKLVLDTTSNAGVVELSPSKNTFYVPIDGKEIGPQELTNPNQALATQADSTFVITSEITLTYERRLNDLPTGLFNSESSRTAVSGDATKLENPLLRQIIDAVPSAAGIIGLLSSIAALVGWENGRRKKAKEKAKEKAAKEAKAKSDAEYDAQQRRRMN